MFSSFCFLIYLDIFSTCSSLSLYIYISLSLSPPLCSFLLSSLRSRFSLLSCLCFFSFSFLFRLSALYPVLSFSSFLSSLSLSLSFSLLASTTPTYIPKHQINKNWKPYKISTWNTTRRQIMYVCMYVCMYVYISQELCKKFLSQVWQVDSKS